MSRYAKSQELLTKFQEIAGEIDTEYWVKSGNFLSMDNLMIASFLVYIREVMECDKETE